MPQSYPLSSIQNEDDVCNSV